VIAGVYLTGLPEWVDIGVLGLEALRGELKQRLPEHMVPAGFVGLSRLPLTASGKVDRKALPQVEASPAQGAYVAPRDECEQLVAEAFAELLGVARVGIDDGFFDLGGHSLLAVRLVARLEAATGKSVPVKAVFEAPTVAGLALALAAAEVAADEPLVAVDRSGLLPLSYQQERLWFLDRLDGGAGAAWCCRTSPMRRRVLRLTGLWSRPSAPAIRLPSSTCPLSCARRRGLQGSFT